MSDFITKVQKVPSYNKDFSCDKIDQIVLLREFAKLQNVELSLTQAKELVEINENKIQNAKDFVLFVNAVIQDNK